MSSPCGAATRRLAGRGGEEGGGYEQPDGDAKGDRSPGGGIECPTRAGADGSGWLMATDRR